MKLISSYDRIKQDLELRSALPGQQPSDNWDVVPIIRQEENGGRRSSSSHSLGRDSQRGAAAGAATITTSTLHSMMERERGGRSTHDEYREVRGTESGSRDPKTRQVFYVPQRPKLKPMNLPATYAKEKNERALVKKGSSKRKKSIEVCDDQSSFYSRNTANKRNLSQKLKGIEPTKPRTYYKAMGELNSGDMSSMKIETTELDKIFKVDPESPMIRNLRRLKDN